MDRWTAFSPAGVRRGLCRALWAGLALLTALGVSVLAWTMLQAVGDSGAAEGARGVVVVTLFAGILDLIVVVGLLGTAELQRNSGPASAHRAEASPPG